MDLLHVHLLLNHVPAVGSVGALLVLAWGAIRRNTEVIAVGLVALIAVALLAIPVFLTGESAEARVEGLPGVSDAAISIHQDSAAAALTAIEVAGAVALLALITLRVRRQFVIIPVLATMLVGVIATGLVVRSAALGGKIRHTELSGSSATHAEQHD